MTDQFDTIAARKDKNVAGLAAMMGLSLDQASLVYSDLCAAVTRSGGRHVEGVLTFSTNRMSVLLDGALDVFQATYIRGWNTEACLAQADLWLSLHADLSGGDLPKRPYMGDYDRWPDQP